MSGAICPLHPRLGRSRWLGVSLSRLVATEPGSQSGGLALHPMLCPHAADSTQQARESCVGVGWRRESRLRPDISSLQNKWVPLVAAKPHSPCLSQHSPSPCIGGCAEHSCRCLKGRAPGRAESRTEGIWSAWPLCTQSQVNPGLLPLPQV